MSVRGISVCHHVSGTFCLKTGVHSELPPLSCHCHSHYWELRRYWLTIHRGMEAVNAVLLCCFLSNIKTLHYAFMYMWKSLVSHCCTISDYILTIYGSNSIWDSLIGQLIMTLLPVAVTVSPHEWRLMPPVGLDACFLSSWCRMQWLATSCVVSVTPLIVHLYLYFVTLSWCLKQNQVMALHWFNYHRQVDGVTFGCLILHVASGGSVWLL